MVKCRECGEEIRIPEDVMDGELIVCEGCMTEYEYHNEELFMIELDGCDYGE
jgi:hypothetical protein